MTAPSQVLGDRMDQVPGLRGAEGGVLDDVEQVPVLVQEGLGVEEYRAVELVELCGIELRGGAVQVVDGLSRPGERADVVRKYADGDVLQLAHVEQMLQLGASHVPAADTHVEGSLVHSGAVRSRVGPVEHALPFDPVRDAV